MLSLKKIILKVLKMPSNRFHPMVHIWGTPSIGKGTYIGLFSEINAHKGTVKIGDNCDIASFVAINCADSHRMTIKIDNDISRYSIVIENNVFIGSHSFIGGNIHIGHHSVIAAGTILTQACVIPPYSLVIGNPARIKESYYENNFT